jgi:hypothetical protein
MAKVAVEIVVNGEPGRRVSVRCRCKARFMVEVTVRAWDAWRIGGNVLALGLLDVHNACEGIQKWIDRAPRENITRSFFAVEALLWAPKANGATTNCGGACRSAKGPQCDCKCRGAHHGAGIVQV